MERLLTSGNDKKQGVEAWQAKGGSLVRWRRDQGRCKTTLPRISRHTTKGAVTVTSLMQQEKQSTIGRGKALRGRVNLH